MGKHVFVGLLDFQPASGHPGTPIQASLGRAFPSAWGLPPKKSRLMHGAGVIALGFVMDAIADQHRSRNVPSRLHFLTGIGPIVDHCRWTDGYWDFGAKRHVKWCDLQNTPAHIQMLTDHMLSLHRLTES